MVELLEQSVQGLVLLFLSLIPRQLLLWVVTNPVSWWLELVLMGLAE